MNSTNIKNIFVIAFHTVSLLSCNSTTSNTTQTEQKDSAIVSNTAEQAEEDEFGATDDEDIEESNKIRPEGFRYYGDIDGKHPIDLNFYSLSKEDQGQVCSQSTGSYHYTNSSSSFDLNAEFCPEEKTFRLIRHKNGAVRELFEGKYDESRIRIVPR